MSVTDVNTDRTEVSDAVLAACRRGDRDAQHQLCETYRRRIYRLMVRMVGEQDAGDLTQQAFLKTFQSIDKFSGRSQFGTWLYRLSINEALQHIRRNRRSREQVVSPAVIENATDPKRENADERDALAHAIARLDPQLRSIFLLKEVERLSYCEIAAVLDISEGTVGSRLNRARTQLKETLTSTTLPRYNPRREASVNTKEN